MKSSILRILLRKHPIYSIDELLGTSVLEGMIGFVLLPPTPTPGLWCLHIWIFWTLFSFSGLWVTPDSAGRLLLTVTES